MRRKERVRDAGPPLAPLPPSVREARGVWRIALPFLLLCYLGFAGLHAYHAPEGATGYQNAPDEAAHVAYVRSVAQGRLPTARDGQQDPVAYEWHQPPLYYAVAALFASGGYTGLRWVSITWGVVGILLIYRTSRLLLPDAPLVAIMASGFAALLPGRIAVTSTVNNDALLEVGFSATLLMLCFCLTNGVSLWRAGWIGLFLGLSVLTKATALLLLLVIVFGFWAMWRQGERVDGLIRSGFWALAVAFTVSGWWFARNNALYGEWIPLRAFHRAFAGTAQATDIAAQLGGWESYWRLAAIWSFQSFWAVYGTARTAAAGVPVFLPGQVYILAGMLTVVGVCGGIRAHLRRRVDFTETQIACIRVLFVAGVLVGASFLLFLTRYFQAQGRYLYPAMLPISLLFALGWRSMIPERYMPVAVTGVLLLLMAFTAAFLRYALPHIWP